MNFAYSQSSSQTIAQYINDGLPRDIISQNQECYSTMKFVDYDAVAREVIVLIAGVDPQMHSTVCRDVFVDGFVRVFVRPLLLQKFSDLLSVRYLKTTDGEFDDAVKAAGGVVEYSNHWTNPKSFYDCMKLFGDNHPSVQGCLKATFAKKGHPTQHDNYTASLFTTPTFFNRFDLGWYVTDETHVLMQDGEVYWGYDAIAKVKDLLPPLLRLRETTGPHKWLLIADSAAFFTDEKFKICIFD